MAIGRTFEEALQKAMRMTDMSIEGFEPKDEYESEEDMVASMEVANDRRIYALAKALKQGYTPEKLHDLTAIDPWFLYKLKRINDMSNILDEFSPDTLPATTLLQAKKSGFSDRQIGSRIGTGEAAVRAMRKGAGITPFVKQIDTTAAETPAATNYLYTTYNADEHDLSFEDAGTLVRRVRLVLRLGDPHAAATGKEGGDGQLQPRDRLDRLRRVRPPVL